MAPTQSKVKPNSSLRHLESTMRCDIFLKCSSNCCTTNNVMVTCIWARVV